MAKAQQSYRDVLSRLEAKDKEGTSLEDAYDALSFLPGTGEVIAGYELPEVLSQSGKMISSDDFVEAAAGTALGTLGIASVLPMVGPAAKAAKKGLEGFIPYLGPKTATAGGPDIDTGITKMEGETSGVSNVSDQIDLGSGSLFSPEEKSGRRLLVLSCSDTKCPDVGDMEAVDRYLGPVFKSLKAMGTPADVDVAIMSAKHGLIRADTPIKNYDERMSPKKAEMFKQDAGQMSRIKNTLDGYDNVIVQGGKDYKDVIRAAAGDIKITEIAGGRGIGDQRKAVKQAIAFGKIDTPVYHYSRNVEKGFTKFNNDDAGYDLLSHLGPHVGSTPLAAKERFINQNFTGPVRTFYLQTKDLDKAIKMAKDRYPRDSVMFSPSGNLGKDKSGEFIPRKGYGGSIPLKADLSRPFLNPDTNEPFTEAGLRKWVESYQPDLATVDQSFQTARTLRTGLAAEEYTHIPYINDVEDAGNVSYIMLTDRPEGSTKVLQSPAAKKDPAKFDDSDFMMEEGGAVLPLGERPAWLTRALDPSTPMTESLETVRTASIDGKLFPTIRLVNGELVRYSNIEEAYRTSLDNNDFIQFKNDDEATSFSKLLSQMIANKRQNSDTMKEAGGVISLKDKAVNMTRGPQGIEPFIKFMV